MGVSGKVIVGSIPHKHKGGAMRVEMKNVYGKDRLFVAQSGARTRLTTDRMNAIAEAVQGGCPPEVAAQAVGISHATYIEWMSRGKKRQIRADGQEPSYIQFKDTVDHAMSLCEDALATKWKKLAMQGGTKETTVTRQKVLEDGTIVEYTGERKVEKTNGDWRGIAEFLSRRFPGWRKSEKMEVSGPDGKPIQATVSPIPLDMLSTETKRRILAELEQGHDSEAGNLLSEGVEEVSDDSDVIYGEATEVASMTDLL